MTIIKKVQKMCDDAGVRLEYLPPYSPDLNPIEASFHDLKQSVRSQRFDADSFDTFGDFLHQLVESCWQRPEREVALQESLCTTIGGLGLTEGLVYNILWR